MLLKRVAYFDSCYNKDPELKNAIIPPTLWVLHRPPLHYLGLHQELPFLLRIAD